MQRITPYLWYDSEAEAAAQFYTSLLPNSRITKIDRFPEGGEDVTGKPAGSVMTVAFTLDGQEFVALNGGPAFKFTEAVSFMISCDDQNEVDRLWTALTADGGEESMCGWCKDKFGVSWQIIPKQLHTYLADADPGRAERAMKAMLGMRKIDLAGLKAAADGQTEK